MSRIDINSTPMSKEFTEAFNELRTNTWSWFSWLGMPMFYDGDLYVRR